MSELLPMERIALVGVEDANGAIKWSVDWLVFQPDLLILVVVCVPWGTERAPYGAWHGMKDAYRINGSQMQGFPFLVPGLLPLATLLTNFHVNPLSRLAYRSMLVVGPQLFPLARTVPAG